MRCFNCLLIFFVSINSYAIEYTLSPGSNGIDDGNYYTLAISNDNVTKHIDIGLEGNASHATLREKFSVSCPWGIANVAVISLGPLSIEGNSWIVNYYAFDGNVNNIFAKSYFFANGYPKQTPLSLSKTICRSKKAGVKKGLRTGKDYIENNEIIDHGPFSLKGVADTDVKFVLNNHLAFVKEDRNGEEVIENYENMYAISTLVQSVFFMKVKGESNVVNLISWGEKDNPECYKVYAYQYNKNGVITENIQVNNDPRLYSCNIKDDGFIYTDASKIKKYLIDKYNFQK